MTHLKDAELADLIDGQLPARRASHAEQCGECRGRADELRALLRAVRADDVPEPSPLFWDHFAARVAGAIDAQGPPASHWVLWVRGGRVQWLAAAVALVFVAGVTWRVLTPGSGDRHLPAVDRAVLAGPLSDAAAAAALGEDAWDAILRLTDELGLDDTDDLGIRVRPGAAERMAEDLSDAERSEFARLIEDELKRTGA